jgi:hypothetical protein
MVFCYTLQRSDEVCEFTSSRVHGLRDHSCKTGEVKKVTCHFHFCLVEDKTDVIRFTVCYKILKQFVRLLQGHHVSTSNSVIPISTGIIQSY